MSAARAITAIVPWYGSKRTLAPKIVAALGQHRAYWEPFCGSLAVLLEKPVATMETVSDLHGDLIHLTRVLQHERLGPAFYRAARRLLCSQAEFRDCIDRVRELENARLPSPTELSLTRALDFFVSAWMGRSGTIGSDGGNNFCVRYTANGGSPGKRWSSAVESIPQFRRRLENVIVLNDDGFELCGKIDDAKGNAIYVDPPYLVKGAKYIHDFEANDHSRLAELLGRFRQTRVVVSYYDHQRLAELYPGWQKIDCTVTKSMVSQGRRDAKNTAKAPEVLLVNSGSKELF